MYKILVKDEKTGMFRYLQHKVEITETQTQTVHNDETGLDEEKEVQVGTGKYETKDFEGNKDQTEAKFIETLDIYPSKLLTMVKVEAPTVDLVFPED